MFLLAVNLETAIKWLCIVCMLFVVRRTCDKDDDNIEHHLAAIQIQEMFRKRRAAKEGKHATRLPRPFVQQVFCGHRNSRTMVNFAGQFSCRIFYAVSSNIINVPLIFMILLPVLQSCSQSRYCFSSSVSLSVQKLKSCQSQINLTW